MKISAPSPLRAATLFAVLAALFAAMIAVSYVPMGGLNLAVNVAIAGLIGATITFGFMGLVSRSHTIWLTAAAGGLWLLVLFVLTFADYLTRGWLLPG